MKTVQTTFLIGCCVFWGVVLVLVLPSRKRRDKLASWAIHHGGVDEGPAFLPEEQEPTERARSCSDSSLSSSPPR